MKDSIERRGETIYFDENGTEYVLDENGNRRPPMYSAIVSKPGEFTIHDDSQGHCALCGRLGCRGYGHCFR